VRGGKGELLFELGGDTLATVPCRGGVSESPPISAVVAVGCDDDDVKVDDEVVEEGLAGRGDIEDEYWRGEEVEVAVVDVEEEEEEGEEVEEVVTWDALAEFSIVALPLREPGIGEIDAADTIPAPSLFLFDISAIRASMVFWPSSGSSNNDPAGFCK